MTNLYELLQSFSFSTINIKFAQFYSNDTRFSRITQLNWQEIRKVRKQKDIWNPKDGPISVKSLRITKKVGPRGPGDSGKFCWSYSLGGQTSGLNDEEWDNLHRSFCNWTHFLCTQFKSWGREGNISFWLLSEWGYH